MTDDPRTDDGRWQAKHTDDQYIKSVENNSPAGTAEIADELDVNVETARLRLRQLADQGDLQMKKIANRLVFRAE